MDVSDSTIRWQPQIGHLRLHTLETAHAISKTMPNARWTQMDEAPLVVEDDGGAELFLAFEWADIESDAALAMHGEFVGLKLANAALSTQVHNEEMHKAVREWEKRTGKVYERRGVFPLRNPNGMLFPKEKRR